MEFNLAEKLAIVKALDRVILADNIIEKTEMAYLGQLMRVMDFNSEFVEEARKFNIKQSHSILREMNKAKKRSLTIMLNEMAYADGDLNREEMKVLLSIFDRAGIELEDPDETIPQFDIADIYFKSKRQIHRKNGEVITETNLKKAVKVEPHIQEGKGYSVTIFELNGLIPFWGNKVEVSPKQMEAKEIDNNRTILKGYKDLDPQTNELKDHSDFGLSICHSSGDIEKIILHRYKDEEEIEFLK